MRKNPSDVIVVGGGAIGAAIAWRSAQRGASVRIVDPAPASGASGAAAGMLAPVTELHYGEEDLLALNLASSEMYPTWVAELEEYAGASTGFRACGTIFVARDRDDDAALLDIFRYQQELGLKVERLSGAEARAMMPGLAPRTRGAILVEGDHQVDPALLTDTLLVACKRAGVDLISDRVVAVTDQGTVRTAKGDIFAADAVVIAAGAASAAIEGAGARLPVRPVKGQLLELRAEREILPIDRNVRGLDVYLVPRSDGRLVVGATVEEKGWDGSATAGAVHDLLRYAYELVPGITELTFTEVRVGFRPGTPDNAPLLGPLTEKVFAATGHFRNGILLTPITAESMVELIFAGRSPAAIERFAPGRFSGLEVQR